MLDHSTAINPDSAVKRGHHSFYWCPHHDCGITCLPGLREVLRFKHSGLAVIVSIELHMTSTRKGTFFHQNWIRSLVWAFPHRSSKLFQIFVWKCHMRVIMQYSYRLNQVLRVPAFFSCLPGTRLLMWQSVQKGWIGKKLPVSIGSQWKSYSNIILIRSTKEIDTATSDLFSSALSPLPSASIFNL